MKNNKGFTLIELLVVIAIIGILSSVVLVSLNSARQKAKFAAGQATLKGIQPALVLCSDSGTSPALTTYVVGSEICSNSIGAVWPAITDWTGVTSATVAASGIYNLTASCSAATCGTAKTCTASATSTNCI